MDLRDFFIAAHALSSVTAFFVGLVLIFSKKEDKMAFAIYFLTILGMAAFLAGAIIWNWEDYERGQQHIFSALFLLALYMLYRAHNALGKLQNRPNNWQNGFIDDVGFTLISLFEGFIIVLLLRLNNSWLLVGIFAILGVVLGNFVIGIAKNKH